MLHNWFEVKICYPKMGENGIEKKVTESYLFDALSCTEAEARAIEVVIPFINGEYQIGSVKKVKFSEVFLSEGDFFFKCKVLFITIDEKSGSEKKTPTNMLVQAYHLKDAIQRLDKEMEGSMADYLINSVTETPIMDVHPYEKESE